MSYLEEGPIPLYVQLKNILRQQIENGEWKPDMALPSEQVLMDTYGVSRTTVRQALAQLAEDNIIVKVQGKGNYVQRTEVKQDLVSLRTINEVLTSAGLLPEVHILSVDIKAHAPQHVCQQLQIAPDAHVVRIKRQHAVKGSPIAYAVIYISAQFQWRLSTDELTTQSIYAWLEQESDVVVDKAIQVIKAAAASEEVASALDLSPGSPVLLVENTSTSKTDIPIDFTEFYFPPERYALVATLRRTHRGISLANVQADVVTSRSS